MRREQDIRDFTTLDVTSTLFFREGALHACFMMAQQGPVVRNHVRKMFLAEGVKADPYKLMPKLVKVGLVEKTPHENSFRLTWNGQELITALAT